MPKTLPLLFLSLILAVSCTKSSEDSDTTSNSGEISELENRIAQLELDNSLKDSVINESLQFFNEIQTNLEAIGIRRKEIQDLTSNPEFSASDKTWVLEQIRQINFMREDNAAKMKQLQEELEKNKFEINSLKTMIDGLLKDIEWKDEQISLLQGELDALDSEYSKLFDAYQEKAIQVDQLKSEINTVYYAYGSAKELSANGVIEKKNGFIGIGKKIKLKEEINDDYFTEINALKRTVIGIDGDHAHFVTVHPTGSYELMSSKGRTKLTITDVSEFWKFSKYLVVVVD
jgi:DNA repair exonuclease SbcCD ATPase subunit